MEKLESLRQAGLLERYHITRCELGLDSCIVASAQYVSSSGLCLDKTRLHSALQNVIMSHPSLTTQIVGESSGKPSFVRLRSIDLAQVIEGPSELENAFTDYLARPFKIESNEPLWRLGVLADGTVIFAFHHAVGDGQSGISFHMALLKALNDLPISSMVVNLPPPLLQPVEALTDTSVPWRKLFHEVYGIFAPASWKEGFDTWTGYPVVTEPTLHTNIRLWELSPSDARKLLALCRQHNCTLTAFLYVLAAESFSYAIATFSPEVLEKYKTLSATIAVSLRRFTRTPLEEICDQASKFHCFTPIVVSLVEGDSFLPDSFPWNRAVEFCGTLHSNLDVVRQDIGAMEYLFGHFREYFHGMLGQKRESTFTISNIGRFPTEINGESVGKEWSISSMFFAQCNATCGSAMKLNIVGSPDGSLGTSFTWGEGALDENIAQSFVDRMKEWTARIIVHSDSK